MVLFRTAMVAGIAWATVAGCGPKPASRPTGTTVTSIGTLPATVDAPLELAEDQDLSQARKQFDAMAATDPERAARRTALAGEYARRIDEALDRGVDPEAAFENLLSLTSLWNAAELGDGTPDPELASYAPQARRVRDWFARGGGDREAAAALVALAAMQPDKAADYHAEVRDIFAYADSLSIAQFGDGAVRARPIEILEAMVDKLRAPWVFEQLGELYRTRQRAIESHFRRSGADFATIRAHGEGVLATGRNIVRLHVLANTLDRAPAAIRDLSGIGDNAELRADLVKALRDNPSSKNWLDLAAHYRDSDDEDKDDPATALAVLRVALRTLPDATDLYCAAGKTADDVDNIYLAIDFYEQCLERAPDEHQAASNLAGLYEGRIALLVFGDRPRSALDYLKQLETFHHEAGKRWPDRPLEHDLAAVFATVGRGLVSLGELEAAQTFLLRSIEERPDYPALESMGTVALKQDQFAEAVRYLELALRLPAGKLQSQFQRAKILRLASEAHAGSGNQSKAKRYADAALASWHKVANHGRLIDRFQGELHAERAKVLWQLDLREEALQEFDKAVDADPEGASTHADVVSFLVTRGEPRRALDAYHRALGNYKIGDYFKVYMSLWVLADARRRGVDPDPLAVEYLASRTGRLWYDRLAAYALGRGGLDELRKRATTRARRAELLYYAAVLSDAANDPVKSRALLEQVVATDMVTFFEYDMAKLWLEQGVTAQQSTPTDAASTP